VVKITLIMLAGDNYDVHNDDDNNGSKDDNDDDDKDGDDKKIVDDDDDNDDDGGGGGSGVALHTQYKLCVVMEGRGGYINGNGNIFTGLIEVTSNTLLFVTRHSFE
jgi:hypothetical protein